MADKKLGWFNTLGRRGDRDIGTQMEGLDKLVAEITGKTVLDAGAAEGLISIELAKAGAKSCLGLEVVAGHVEVGNALAAAAGVPCEFVQSNMNDDDITAMDQRFDIVLMLACLHKLKQPAKVCADLASLCDDLCVIRLPPSGPVIVDDRSERVPQNISKVMTDAGFDLEWQGRAPMDEWIGYFRRRHPAVIGVDLAAGKDQTVIVDVAGDQVVGVQRVWADGKLVYSKDHAAESETLASERVVTPIASQSVDEDGWPETQSEAVTVITDTLSRVESTFTARESSDSEEHSEEQSEAKTQRRGRNKRATGKGE